MATKKLTFENFRAELERALKSLKNCSEKPGKSADSISKFYCYLCRKLLFAYDNPDFETEIKLSNRKNIAALKKNIVPLGRCSNSILRIRRIFKKYHVNIDGWEPEQNIMRDILESLFQKLFNGFLTTEFVEQTLIEFNEWIGKK